MPELDRKALKEALDNLPPRPWTVWTSCSFRRITGPDGKEGGVLHAYNQRSDGHPDLSMSEEKLEALCRAINDAPALLASLEEAERRPNEWRDAHRELRRVTDSEAAAYESNIEALTARAEAAEQRERRLREAIGAACDALKIEARANEMSANIMRDPARTGGWRGAENVANSYDRHGLKVAGIRATLRAALSEEEA